LPKAHAEGLNAENFLPAIDNKSGIMWETPCTIPQNSFLYGYTFSYAYRPVEFGDGKSERISVLDHLQVNHFSMGYGVRNWMSVGASMPLALYSNPSNVGGYLPSMANRDRNVLFPGDLTVKTKFELSSLTGNSFLTGIIGQITFPTGTRSAMLTDDAVKMSAEIPMSFLAENIKTEFQFTTGVSNWQAADRVYASPTIDTTQKILQKENALLLSGGVKYWIIGRPREYSPGNLFVDGGVRGEFSDYDISLSQAASPVEWSGGAGYFVSPSLSVHGAFGTGIGSGVAAPLMRMAMGVRYTAGPNVAMLSEDTPETMLSTSAYSDYELMNLMDQAKAEPIPPSLGEDESYLKLKVSGEVVDIGRIRFEFNSAKLAAEAKETVRRLFEELRRIAPNSVRIDGHTDSVGSYRYNLALSKRRAESVRMELIRLGFDGSIVSTEGFSYKYPVTSNAMKTGRALNRRIEVAVDGESFRGTGYQEEESVIREWIAPSGKKPKTDHGN
jgi:outer membrane protein OmpA-like peptidoglycan-associated protein